MKNHQENITIIVKLRLFSLMQLISPFFVIICNQPMINAEIYFNVLLLQCNFFKTCLFEIQKKSGKGRMSGENKNELKVRAELAESADSPLFF
jgi:hypothetical protein